MNDGRDRTAPLLDRARWARWRRLERVLQLPTTAQGYAVFASCLLILAFTMVLHITLSAEIMRMEVQVYELRQEHARIEQANANMIWKIAGYSALQDIDARADALNYTAEVPVKYVVRPLLDPLAPFAPVPGPEAAPEDLLAQGRVLVMTPPQALQPEEPQAAQAVGEPQVAAGAAGAAAQPEPAWRSRWAQVTRIYENFQTWLRTLAPARFQQAP